MPTSILFWNVRDFSINKINNPSIKRQVHSTITRNAASNDRLGQMLTLIDTVSPDIFVLVETETIRNTPGTLVRGGGMTASIQLLNEIRIRTKRNDWMLVPPLITGPKEGVSVYYRSTNRYFTGPNKWSGGVNGISQAPGLNANDYPNNLKNRLPNRNIPGTSPNNPNVSEQQVAAKIDYTYSDDATIDLAGEEVDFGRWRAPYMTTFAEYSGGGALIRTISLFSVHSPASYNSAVSYLEDLALYEEITSDPAGNEVKVVAGDFNVNSLQTTNNYVPSPAYQELIDQGFGLTIAPTNNVPDPLDGYLGYFATHIKPARHARYGSTIGNVQFYPGYGYMGSDQGTFVAIDNIFVRYGGAPVATPVTTILNTIVGAPFDVYDAPPHTPTGDFPLNNTMSGFFDTYPAKDPPQQAPAYNVGVQTNFKGWSRYGRIYSVSDHFALLVDV